MMVWILCAACALVIGAALGWLIGNGRQRNAMGILSAEVRTNESLISEFRGRTERLESELDRERSEHNRSREELAGLRSKSDIEQRAAQEKIETLLDVEKNLKEAFGSLAASALDANSKRLLELNRAELASHTQNAAKELGIKESSIALLLKPMSVSLEQLSKHTRELETKREGAYNAIHQQVQEMRTSHVDLRRETTQLTQALRAPKVRGNWGEMQLRRCVEYAGMLEHASFDVEKFVRGDDSSARPDLVIYLPNERCIIVDAKTPLDAFLNASGCDEEGARSRYLLEHAYAVRKQLNSLAAKAYWNRFVQSPDFVVCFLPSEVLFSAALEQDPSLLEHSSGGNVLLASPTTLIALLKAVAYGWQQSQIARDAQIIRDAAIKVQSKLAGMHSSFLDLGKHLHKAGESYDDAMTKAQGRGGLFSIAKQLRELKIGEEDIKESRPIAFHPKILNHEDWGGGLSLAANGTDNGRSESDL